MTEHADDPTHDPPPPSGGLPADEEPVAERFQRLYAAHFDAMLGYALRRVEVSEDAADVVAETFLVAWRRIADVPAEPRTRLWLYGVARRTLDNHRRGGSRRVALGDRLRHQLSVVVPDHATAVTEHLAAADALSRLAARDREVLELAAWEGLEPREIAEVLGTSAIAVRTRLSRSRRRLRELTPDAVPTTDLTPGESR